MGMNYELERHILAARLTGKEKGADELERIKNEFNTLVDSGLVDELPREIGLSESTTRLSRRPKRGLYEINGGQIKERRKTLGLRQGDIAGLVGRSQTFISTIERGKTTRINPDTANRLYSALGITSSTPEASTSGNR